MKSSDSRMLITARKLLYGEMAIAMDVEYKAMEEEMDEYLGQ